MKLTLMLIGAFIVGALAESAIRDNRLVEKLEARVTKLEVMRCELAKDRGVKQDDCN